MKGQMHIAYSEPPDKRRNDLRNLRTLTPLLWSYRGRVMLALASLILSKFAVVGVPLLLKEIVDTLTLTDEIVLVMPMALLLGYGGLRLAGNIFNELRDVIFARVRHGAMRQLSVRVMAHLHQLSLRFHLERKTGGISRDIERGTRSVSSLLNYLVFSILPILVEFGLVTIILLTYYQASFMVVALVSVVAYTIFTFVITTWRMKFRQQMNTHDTAAGTQAIDSLINYETVKYFGNESFELERYGSSMAQWEEAAVKTQSSMSLLSFGQAAIIAVAVTVIMVIASEGVVAGELTVGDLVMINAFLLQLFMPLGFLGMVYSQLQHALTDLEHLYDLLGKSPEIVDAPGSQSLVVNGGGISFEHVDFSYQPERQILRDVNFEVAPGQKVAVVGASGAGKSSLVRLLFRFYDIDGGSIRIDGQDIRAVTQQSLRAAIGIVPQDTVLFNESIFYNIAYARIGASQSEVEAAARLAHIHDFITSLPDGYDTVVGERGLKLSGGEKQRVAIARVILKDPAILIFDEATSSLDSRSEQLVQAALKEVAADRTTLVIAHRLSTVVDADEILVLDQGRVIERGNHAALLQVKGSYAEMWRLQESGKSVVVD